MSGIAPPPGHLFNLALIERIRDIGDEIENQRVLLRQIGDPGLKSLLDPLQQVLAAANAVLGAHGGAPGADVAQELAGLLSLTRAVRLPTRDPETGETSFNLDRMRGAQGRMVMALANALDAARALGLVPPDPALPGGLPAEVPRAGNEDLLRDIAATLDQVSAQLAELEKVKAEPSEIRRQEGLIAFYLGAMRVQVDLARLQLTLGERTVDFAALSRASQTMAELTGDFFATVMAWAGRVAAAVRHAAGAIRDGVKHVLKATSLVIENISRNQRKAQYTQDLYKYRAFISYSRNDVEYASILHRRLEAWRVPSGLVGQPSPTGVITRRLGPIFRDIEGLRPGDSISDALDAALDSSAALIVICSMDSAKSIWVNEEISRFRARHPKRPIIPVIADVPGETEVEDVFPQALRHELSAAGEATSRSDFPAFDMRFTSDGFALAVVKVLGGLLGENAFRMFRSSARTMDWRKIFRI